MDPDTAGLVGQFSFYITLSLSLIGIITLLGTLLRKRFTPGMFTEHLRTSARQAILLALLISGLLILQSASLLFWWVGLTLILFIITLEIFLNA